MRETKSKSEIAVRSGSLSVARGRMPKSIGALGGGLLFIAAMERASPAAAGQNRRKPTSNSRAIFSNRSSKSAPCMMSAPETWPRRWQHASEQPASLILKFIPCQR